MASPKTSKTMCYDQIDAEGFLNDLWEMIKDKRLAVGGRCDEKVTEFIQPEEMQKFLDVDITKAGTNRYEILELCEKVIKYSVKTGHPHFFNRLHSSADTYSVGGLILAGVLNTHVTTYDIAPVFTTTENCVLRKISSLIDFKHYDGTFLPGGSIGNMMGVHLARFQFNKSVREDGLFGSKKLVIFCSEDAHYSLKKGAFFMGFGTSNCILLKTDQRGRMEPADLERKIVASKVEGNIPLFVMATAGTTVLGAFDPINKIADICDRHKLWLHVDAAIGGSFLLSNKHKHLLDGVHRANSFQWNFHKLTRTSIQCSAFLVQHQTLLEECNAMKADCLFQPDKLYDSSFDSGDKTIQCGRPADSFKLWVQWRARGDDGMAWIIEHAFDNAQYLTEQLREHEAFRLVIPEFECINICFWYIPSSLRGQEENDAWWQKIHQVTALIMGRMLTEGTLMTYYQPLPSKGFVNFFRVVICNPESTHKDMDFVIEEIDRLGKDL